MDTLLPMTVIDLARASDQEYEAVAILQAAMRAERMPDEPAIPLADVIAPWRHLPDFVKVRVWAIWNAEQTAIVAGATLQMLLMDTNRAMAEVSLDVLPAYRRQGLARRLLQPIHEALVADERSLIFTGSSDRVPAGEALLERLGAARGVETHTNQLDLAELDRDLLRRWLSPSEQASAMFELGAWDGPYPEEDLAAIAELHEVMNQQPLDNLEMEDVHFSPEQLRMVEQTMFANGNQRWTLYVRERATGKLAGFTEIIWHANRGHLVRQLATGVFPAYRGHGLGRWLKAATLDRVLSELPTARVVRTDNADSNAPMLRINTELGFKPYMANVLWQLPTSALADYLAAEPAQR